VKLNQNGEIKYFNSFILKKYIDELLKAMDKNGYSSGRYSPSYYRTLVTIASYFARNEEASTILKESNESKNIQNVNLYFDIKAFAWYNMYSVGIQKLLESGEHLFAKYLKRILFEYSTNGQRSINKEQGKQYVKDILKAIKIETLIHQALNQSNKKIDQSHYSKSLLHGIKQMFEVIL
jgi:hypothetical protein